MGNESEREMRRRVYEEMAQISVTKGNLLSQICKDYQIPAAWFSADKDEIVFKWDEETLVPESAVELVDGLF